jgi:hypothetical protein
MYLHILETITGLVFIYLLISLLVTAIQELISTSFKFRANMLKFAIGRMLNDDHKQILAKDFYNHFLIKYLSVRKDKLPSYISKIDFSKAIVDILKVKSQYADLASSIRKGIDDLPDGDTKKLILSYWEEAHMDMDKFRKLLEQWFDSSMERVSGWYKRKMNRWIIAMGAAITIVLNADTFEIWQRLSSDSQSRQQIVNIADNFVQTTNYLAIIEAKDTLSPGDTSLVKRAQDLVVVSDSIIHKDLQEVKGLAGIGWNEPDILKISINSIGSFFKSLLFWIIKLTGWALTTIAISLGAPFWFDMLSKVIQLRMTGKKPDSGLNS